MYKILYISYFAPYDKVDHAGGKVHNFYIKKLQKEPKCDVTLLTMCYQRECEKLDLEEYGIKHRLVVLDRTMPQKYIRMFFSGFSYFNPWDKYGKILLNYERYRLKKMIRQYAREGEKPDLIVLQWTQIILLMPFVRKLYPDTPVTAIEEDVIFLNFFRRIGLAKSRWQKYIADFQYRNVRQKELAALEEAEQVVVNNFKDSGLLVENGIEKAKIFTSSVYFENYSCVNRDHNSTHTTEKTGEYRDILYYGAMHREENHISAVWFIENVMPHLPGNYRFVIVGARPGKELLALQNDRIKVAGFVEKIEPY
ncbi:MAG: glycosyltransferase family 4 protein, partial [Lachnospiraceae bacterium]|nr:glycosyltransferase family 4 protein [Lachnospiraceae bacterium]